MDVTCPRCGEIYHADESHSGRSLRCRNCGNIVLVEPKVPLAAIGSDSQQRCEQHPISQGKRFWQAPPFFVMAAVILGSVAVMVARFGRETTAETLKEQPMAAEAAPSEPSEALQNPESRNAGRKAEIAPRRESPFAPVGDYPFGLPRTAELPQTTVPPCAQGEHPSRPPTGDRVEADEGISGSSELRIHNGTERDASVRLVDAGFSSTARFIYIRADDDYTVTRIEPGAYSLLFASGRNWVSNCRDFVFSDYFEFERSLVFEEDRNGYTSIEVTLNPVREGNTKAQKIDRERFFLRDRESERKPFAR